MIRWIEGFWYHKEQFIKRQCFEIWKRKSILLITYFILWPTIHCYRLPFLPFLAFRFTNLIIKNNFECLHNFWLRNPTTCFITVFLYSPKYSTATIKHNYYTLVTQMWTMYLTLLLLFLFFLKLEHSLHDKFGNFATWKGF